MDAAEKMKLFLMGLFLYIKKLIDYLVSCILIKVIFLVLLKSVKEFYCADKMINLVGLFVEMKKTY